MTASLCIIDVILISIFSLLLKSIFIGCLLFSVAIALLYLLNFISLFCSYLNFNIIFYFPFGHSYYISFLLLSYYFILYIPDINRYLIFSMSILIVLNVERFEGNSYIIIFFFKGKLCL